MLKLIIFDWDGVFVTGTNASYVNCYKKTIERLKIDLEGKEIEKRIKLKWGAPHQVILKELVKESPVLLKEACKIYEKYIFGKEFVNSPKIIIIPGSVQLLRRLRNRYSLVVATGAHLNVVRKLLKRFNVSSFFPQIVSCHDYEDITKTKPHPRMLEQIIKKKGVRKNEVVYVGDSESDLIMAKNAGIIFVAVLTGHLSLLKARGLGAKHIIKDVTKLEQVLRDEN